jgi:alkylation response protein AidB-like acyl-CoA dehydrogenase
MILNEEQRLLRSTVADFLNREAPIEALRFLRDKEQAPAWEPALWQGLCELGAPAVAQPEQAGGLGFGAMGMGALMIEAGRRLSASPLVSSAIFAQAVIRLCGNAAQGDRLSPGLMSGENVATVACQEGTHFQPQPTQCRRDADQLSGRKTMVLDAGSADYLLVTARDQNGALCIGRLACDAAGVTITPHRFMDGRQYATVELIDALVDEWLQGEQIAVGFQRALDETTIMLSAEMLGGSRELLERTLAYLQEREQFDVKIGTFQALQHRIAEAYCQLELAAASVYSALSAIDADSDALSEHASRAKALTGDIYQHLSNEAVQMHGGMGVTDEMDIGLFLKRSRVCNQLWGDSAFHKDRFAALRGY